MRAGLCRNLLVVGTLAFGGHVMIWAAVRAMVYPMPRTAVPFPAPSPLREVKLESRGKAVSAWWLEPTRPDAPVLLLLHGNGDHLETVRRAGLFDAFAAAGVGVLAIDYPGYGRSAGVPGETANIEAAGEAWHWLVARPDFTGPRLLMGWSLGAAVAVQVAAADSSSVDGLILLSAWDRLAAVAGREVAEGLLAVVLPETYDSLSVASSITAPVLMIHGREDVAVPIQLGRRLRDGFPVAPRWVEVAGAGHNDLFGRDETWTAIESFLAEMGGGLGDDSATAP